MMMELELCLAKQSCVRREYSMGLRTFPCGIPVLRINVEVMVLTIFTCFSLPVRKFNIHLHRVTLKPRRSSFWVHLDGMTVLNADL